MNLAKESILVKDTGARYMIEFAENHLMVTVNPNHIVILEEWVMMRKILDTNLSNDKKYFAFQLPGFDKKKFPFIAVCGSANLGIVNIRDYSFHPLIN